MAQAPPMLVIAVSVSFTELGMSELLSVFERIVAFILTIPQQICEQVWRNGLHESHKYNSKHNFHYVSCNNWASLTLTSAWHCHECDRHIFLSCLAWWYLWMYSSFRANMGLTNYLYNGYGIFCLCTLFHMFKSVRNLVICLKLSVTSWWHIV